MPSWAPSLTLEVKNLIWLMGNQSQNPRVLRMRSEAHTLKTIPSNQWLTVQHQTISQRCHNLVIWLLDFLLSHAVTKLTNRLRQISLFKSMKEIETDFPDFSHAKQLTCEVQRGENCFVYM